MTSIATGAARAAALAAGLAIGGNAVAQQVQKPVEPQWWPGKVRSAAASAPGTSGDLASGAAWKRLLDELARAGELVQGGGTPASDIDRAEGYRHLGSLLRSGLGEALVDADPDHPRFSFADMSGKWGLDCADALYASALVRGGAAYRIRGRRGSAHFMGFQLMAGMRPAADVDADSLALGPDGSFELVLSKDRRPGNWIELPDDATTLHVRQFFYDWDHELPASLWIERIDGAAPTPQGQVSSAAVERWLDALGGFVRSNADYWKQVSIAKREQANSFPSDHGIGAIAGASQKYQAFGVGYYKLADDEALIVEVKPPKAKYWSLHLGNFWMESLDFANHQSSLNGYQARLDSDGVFRAVVAHRDPGVPNWLDTAGHAEGSMIYRWNQADASPIPSARVVKFSALRAALPPDTPRVTPAERAEQIERRRAHVQRRFARPL